MEHHIQFSHEDHTLILLDQRLLPLREEYVVCGSAADVVSAIKEMAVRGAPAIGVAAAWGCLLAAYDVRDRFDGKKKPGQADVSAGEPDWRQALDALLRAVAQARPTAVNLARAVARMRQVMEAAQPQSPRELIAIWTAEAERIHAEDIAANKRLGAYGAAVIADGDTVLTHCNAGALATAGYGTALGVIYAAHEQGKRVKVIADETRPLLQGARLTAYELHRAGIPVAVACDNACAFLMRRGMVQKVIVGADRIAANGDTANKIGTYAVALAAKAHNIPFYIAAPLSTIDCDIAGGRGIPIEERSPLEVTHMGGVRITPEGVSALNYAFDVTPAEYITGIITEAGILYPPYDESIDEAVKTP